MPISLRLLLLIGLLPAMALHAAPAQLQTAPAVVEKIPIEERFDAVIEAVNRSTVSAQTAGRVEEINFDVDDYVTKGTVLIRLRGKEQQAALASAEARFREAQAEFTRIRDVYQQKLVAKSAYDKAEADLHTARAALDQAREQVGHTVVTAPYSGIVTQRHIELGETANPGTPLMSGISLERLRAVANVPQAYVEKVRAVDLASVSLSSPRPMQFESRQVTVAPYIDPQTHTFKVRVELPPGQHGIFPGMFAKVGFVTGQQEALVVPQEAVAYRSEVTALYVVEPDGRVSMRHVRLGELLPNGKVVVLAGLSADEKVALDPVRAGVVLKEQRAGKSS